jgi:hypothetical protein
MSSTEVKKCYRRKSTGRCTLVNQKNPQPTDDCRFSERRNRCVNRYKTVKKEKTGSNTVSKKEVDTVLKKITGNVALEISPNLSTYLWQLLNKKRISSLREKDKNRGLGMGLDGLSDKEVLLKLEEKILYTGIFYAQSKGEKRFSRNIVKKAIHDTVELRTLFE